MASSEWIYAWGNNETRAALKGRPCRIIFKGKMNSVLVEFRKGERVVTSIRALRVMTCEQRGHPLTQISPTRYVCECGRRAALLPLTLEDELWLKKKSRSEDRLFCP